jgi:hypothetical protein
METEYRGYIPDGGISTCFCAIAQRGLVRLIPEFTSGPSEAVFYDIGNDSLCCIPEVDDRPENGELRALSSHSRQVPE